MKESNNGTGTRFLQSPNPSAFMLNKAGGSSGAGSYKSGFGKNDNGSTDETNS